MILAATGHRPNKLGGHDTKTRRALGAFAIERLHWARPEKVIVGMALGWDQAMASACVALGIPFIAAVPFPGQADQWPEAARHRWQSLLLQAEHVEYVEQTYGRETMQNRNRWMVDRCDEVLALWDGTMGGTYNCIRYAEKVGKPVTNTWWRWALPDDARDLL